MNNKFLLLLLLLAVILPASVFADTLSYANVGTQAQAATFHATQTGTITAYFIGARAEYSSVIGMAVNGAPVGIWGLNNHSSAVGQALVLGNVHAGDVIDFNLFVTNTNQTWSSDAALNLDHFNHVYATSYVGDQFVPAGTFVGFEDLLGGGDRDYDDIEFVFTNTAAAFQAPAPPSVPEPATMSLFGLGLASLTVLRKKRPA